MSSPTNPLAGGGGLGKDDFVPSSPRLLFQFPLLLLPLLFQDISKAGLSGLWLNFLQSSALGLLADNDFVDCGGGHEDASQE